MAVWYISILFRKLLWHEQITTYSLHVDIVTTVYMWTSSNHVPFKHRKYVYMSILFLTFLKLANIYQILMGWCLCGYLITIVYVPNIITYIQPIVNQLHMPKNISKCFFHAYFYWIIEIFRKSKYFLNWRNLHLCNQACNLLLFA